MASAFETFVSAELPKRPWSAGDGVGGDVLIRKVGGNARELDWITLANGEVLGKDGTGVVKGINLQTTIQSLIAQADTRSIVHPFTNSASVTVTHAFANSDPIVQVFDAAGKAIIPNEITVVDNANITIEFGIAVSGKVVAIFAG